MPRFPTWADHSGEEKLREELGTPYGNVNGYEGRPTRSQIDRMAVFEKQTAEAEAKLAAAAEKEFATLKAGPVSNRLDRLPSSWIQLTRSVPNPHITLGVWARRGRRAICSPSGIGLSSTSSSRT